MSSVISSFPTNNLEVCSAFVLDRSTFLDTIVDAVQIEDTNADAMKMLDLVRSNQLINVVGRCLTDKDSVIIRKALLALGNLIASDDSDIRSDALAVAAKALDTLRTLGLESELGAGAAFVLRNLAMFRTTDDDIPIEPLIGGMIRDYTYLSDHRVLSDLLWGALTIGAYKTVDTESLLSILLVPHKKTRFAALNLLGDQISEDNFPSRYHERAYAILTSLLIHKEYGCAKGLRLLLWSLSNLVVEADYGKRFLTDVEVRERIVKLSSCRSESKWNIAKEATWILVNAIAKTDLTSVFEDADELRDQLYDTLQAADELCANNTERKALTEAITKVASFYNMYVEWDEEKTEEEEEAYEEEEEAADETDTMPDLSNVMFEIHNPDAADMEIDDTFAPPPQAIPEGFDLPCELPAPHEFIFNQCLGTYFPPNAIGIITNLRSSYGTSKVVHDLITRVSSNNGAFTALEDNIVLTVKDIKDLEMRGFVLAHGSVGINPLISTALYSS